VLRRRAKERSITEVHVLSVSVLDVCLFKDEKDYVLFISNQPTKSVLVDLSVPVEHVLNFRLFDYTSVEKICFRPHSYI